MGERRRKDQQGGQRDFLQQSREDEDASEEFWRALGDPVPTPWPEGIPPWKSYRPPTSEPGAGRLFRLPTGGTVPVADPIRGLVRGLQEARSKVPKGWSPNPEELKALFPIDPRRSEVPQVRSAHAIADSSFEPSWAVAEQGLVEETDWRVNRDKARLRRKAIAAAIAAGAAGGAAALWKSRPRGGSQVPVTKPWSGGGGGLHVNWTARMNQLTGRIGAR